MRIAAMALELPPTYLLKTRLSDEEIHELEEQIGSSLTYALPEARLVLGKVATKQRALYELRSRKLLTEEAVINSPSKVERKKPVMDHVSKRRRIQGVEGREVAFTTAHEESDVDLASHKEISNMQNTDNCSQSHSRDMSPVTPISSSIQPHEFPAGSERPHLKWDGTIKVVKLAWYKHSLQAGYLLPLQEYLVYEGKLASGPYLVAAEPVLTKVKKIPRSSENILLRAADDAPRLSLSTFPKHDAHRQPHKHRIDTHTTRSSHLLRQTTSEQDEISRLPPLPDYLRSTYSCERPTPLYSHNDPFICELKKIKQIRNLRGDGIGVRAYSTAIASLAAYPYVLSSAQEVMRLPRCSEKYGMLYEEWRHTGHCVEADELDKNEELQILNIFWNIWGIGASTARKFYNNGWKDIADIVEFGWHTLTRSQKIGVKYYDELLLKIPRKEVEEIGGIILSHANKLHPGCQMCIVGGYRRGKPESGDVDVIISHPDEAVTAGFVEDICVALEKSQHITHTLSLSLANTERGQVPVSWKGEKTARGNGFDTLDKALVVWQDPHWLPREEELKANPKAKNPNVHRRVDILVSPWKTFGCAVLGWTSGTTFQRDLRNYCKRVKNFKFDSSGIRSRKDGHWVDFESNNGIPAPDYLTAEKRVFEGLGLEWREPELRCTG